MKEECSKFCAWVIGSSPLAPGLISADRRLSAQQTLLVSAARARTIKYFKSQLSSAYITTGKALNFKLKLN